MDEPNKSQFFADLRDLIVTYFQERLELAKALAYEKIARIIAFLFIGLMMVLFFFFGILFLSFMLAMYFSELLHSQMAGYGIVAAIYFVAFLFFFAFRNSFVGNAIASAVIRILYDHQNNPNHG
jgi:hypothetical protein